MSDHVRDETETLLDRQIAQLAEHFDSVRVFVTRRVVGGDGPKTEACTKGSGSWYAQIGQVKEWVLVQDHTTRLNVERQATEDE